MQSDANLQKMKENRCIPDGCSCTVTEECSWYFPPLSLSLLIEREGNNHGKNVERKKDLYAERNFFVKRESKRERERERES